MRNYRWRSGHDERGHRWAGWRAGLLHGVWHVAANTELHNTAGAYSTSQALVIKQKTPQAEEPLPLLPTQTQALPFAADCSLLTARLILSSPVPFLHLVPRPHGSSDSMHTNNDSATCARYNPGKTMAGDRWQRVREWGVRDIKRGAVGRARRLDWRVVYIDGDG